MNVSLNPPHEVTSKLPDGVPTIFSPISPPQAPAGFKLVSYEYDPQLTEDLRTKLAFLFVFEELPVNVKPESKEIDAREMILRQLAKIEMPTGFRRSVLASSPEELGRDFQLVLNFQFVVEESPVYVEC